MGRLVKEMFSDVYRYKKVLVTGDSGFKGSWMTCWLQNMGANVYGLSLDVPSVPNHAELVGLDYQRFKCDINDTNTTREVLKKINPDVIFHFAAQALVRKGYEQAYQTFLTNIMGTASLIEAAKQCDSVKAVIIATSDKCYLNSESGKEFVETDPLGGYDPYSASKAAAEIVAQSYRSSILDEQQILLATVRAGNVIGGGDWGQDRLIPDIMRSAALGNITLIRSPQAIRPWQHVLEPLSGYLVLGEKLINGFCECAEAWNFGPESRGHLSVKQVCNLIEQEWDSVAIEMQPSAEFHEASTLKLNCRKAKEKLGWSPVWSVEKTIEKTVEWYKAYYEHGHILSHYHLKEFIEEAKIQEKTWVNSTLEAPH